MATSRAQGATTLLMAAILAVFPGRAAALETGGAVYIKSGAVQLLDNTQVFDGMGLPVNVDINTRSAKTLNIGWELRLPRGWAVGTEYLGYHNRFTPQGSNRFGTAETDAFMVTGKKYFAVSGAFHPYLGGGIGTGFTHVANTRTGGSVDNSDFAILLHALLGVELRIEDLSVLLEARSLFYTVDPEKADLDPGAASLLLGFGFNW